jgi:hypothetical protein
MAFVVLTGSPGTAEGVATNQLRGSSHFLEDVNLQCEAMPEAELCKGCGNKAFCGYNQVDFCDW